jgi:predicted GIY-YIG superfamily endonuclease
LAKADLRYIASFAIDSPPGQIPGPIPLTDVGTVFAKSDVVHGIGRRFVYILRSESDPARHYVGLTANVGDRLEWHNHGPGGQTSRYRPWKVIVSIEFLEESTAVRFERYLKSPSGRAFARRRFGPDTRISPASS